MTDQVSVAYAIRRARLLLVPLVILPVPLLLFSMNIVLRITGDGIGGIFAFIGLLIGILALVMVYWKQSMIYWQAWAYSNVTNLHELDKAAAIAGIANSYISIGDIEKRHSELFTFIRRYFSQPYIPSDDITVPYETQVYYRRIYQQPVFYIVLSVYTFGISAMVAGVYELGLLCILPATAVLIWRFIATSNRQPQIVLNELGIDSQGKFTPWTSVKEEYVARVTAGRSRRFYLNYDTPEGHHKIKIDDMTIKPVALNHLLFVYRDRHTLSQSHRRS